MTDVRLPWPELIPDASLPLFSATQVDTYDDCVRKWGFYKIERIRGEQNRFAARGEELHKVAENFLLDGTPPPETDAGRVFKAGLKFLPPPGSCLGVEEKFLFYPDGEPFGFSGRIDWQEAVAGGLRIGDHKTTTDKKWIKTVDALCAHPQPIIYAAHALREFPHLSGVEFRWLYYIWEPRRPRAEPRDFQLSSAGVGQQFEKILEKCRHMAAWISKGVRANDLPYDVAACDKYGGCPYREHCGLTPQERLRGIMAQLSLKEKLLARKAGDNGGLAAAVMASPTPEVTTNAKPEAAKAGGSLLDRMKSHMSGKATPAAAVVETKPAPTPAQEQKAPGQAINPKVATVTATVVTSDAARDVAALAVACQQIADGFAAIAAHFKGQQRN